MTTANPTPEHPDHTHDHEHPLLEAFNAEEIVDDPGDVREEPDTTSDSDAPAP